MSNEHTIRFNRRQFPVCACALLFAVPSVTQGQWVLGNAKLDLNTSNILGGTLYLYAQSAAIYHCPADKAVVSGSASVPHTRSYSVEGWLGAVFDFGNGWFSPVPSYVHVTRASMITTPGPSGVFAFIDDNEQTIDDGIFVIGLAHFYDYPADRHNQGANLSYLDGHVEHKRWASLKVAASGYPPGLLPTDVKDHDWLVARLPVEPQ